ncbi:MAG: efflux RND transporter permease subunit [Myxococcota bacterium]
MIEWLVRRRATVATAVLSVFVFGAFTYGSLPREASPDVDVPFVMVTTPYLGVSPEDVESLVTIPIENELTGIKDLKEMRSTSAEGASIVTLEFEPEVQIEDALQRVRDRVDLAEPKLPEDAEDTEVREVSFSDFPILILTIGGPVDEERLKHIGELLEDDIERVSGVLDADLSGGREREIRVQIDPYRLQHYGLSLDDVIGAIAAENVNIPGGDVRTGDANFLLRVPGDFQEPQEIENVAVKRIGDRPVFVRDLGRVVDGFADRDSYARMNGEPAVSIAVSKRAGANILEVAEAVKELARQRAEHWPEGVTFRVLGDQSKFIEDMVSELENGVLTALILVVAVILFFMGVRNSLFVAVSIPLSMLLSMLFIWAFGMTLNMIVLFSLILALGMLVDNAIVLVENIYRHVEEGRDLFSAAIVGTREVAGAVAASTATTVAAFVPLVFWTGIMGQFMGYLPKTVIIVLICSLVVAIGVLPVLTSMAMKAPKRAREQVVDGRVMRSYRSVLEWSIRHRYLSAGMGVATLVGTFVVFGLFNHGTEFFPETDPNRATVTVRAPDGTDLEATDAIVRRVEGMLADLENVDVYVAETGVAGGGDPISGSQSVAHMARITVDFHPDRNTAKPGEKVRVEPTPRTVDRIREQVQTIPGAEIAVEKERMGPPVGKPIAVEVSGEEFHRVGDLASKVRRDLGDIPGVTELTDDYRVGRPEMRLRIDRGAAKRVGASTQDVASTIRTAFAGTTASVLREGDEEHDINVELDPAHRSDLQAVLALRIPGKEDTSPDTFPVPLSTVASYELAGGSGSIRHVDQKLVVTVEGNVEEGYNENAVRAEVADYIERTNAELAGPMALRLGGANDEQREAQQFLSVAFLVAIFLIAFVLVAQFNRFDLPLVILASVVLSLIGVLWGLLVTGTPFGVIMTGLGIISLAGVVVNNAIVLLDYVEQLRARGRRTHDALVEAGMVRFRPVMLTALTTVLGLVPMAVGVSLDFRKGQLILASQSAQWWGPMAVAVIFGLAISTVLTLVLVPTMYTILEDVRGLVKRVPGLGRLVSVHPGKVQTVDAGVSRPLEETVVGGGAVEDEDEGRTVAASGPAPSGGGARSGRDSDEAAE